MGAPTGQSQLTGWPVVGAPPAPLTLPGVDGPVRFEVRWWRAPTASAIALLWRYGHDPGT